MTFYHSIMTLVTENACWVQSALLSTGKFRGLFGNHDQEIRNLLPDWRYGQLFYIEY